MPYERILTKLRVLD